jgi:hypothetical protein
MPTRICWGLGGSVRTIAWAAVFTLLAGQGYQVFMLVNRQLHPWSERAGGVNHWFLQPEHLARLRGCCPALLGPE